MKIYIGADHRGFELKEKVAAWLEMRGIKHEDMGAYSLDSDDDYTEYAEKVARRVADNRAMGVLLCGSGVGVDVVANKFDGIRAGLARSANQIKSARADDDINVLVLAADFTKEDEAKNILEAFLVTKFEGKKRHKRRLKAIEKIEEIN